MRACQILFLPRPLRPPNRTIRPAHLMSANWTEKTMTSQLHGFQDAVDGDCQQQAFHGTTRRPQALQMGYAPQDLGYIPRTYMIKVLFGIQPCTDLSLWEALKNYPDTPLQSYEHLKNVLKMAKETGWVYTEKNLASDTIHYHITKSRTAAVHQMVLDQRAQEDAEEKAKLADDQALAIAMEKRQGERLDNRIKQLESQLTTSVARLIAHDREAVKDLPFVVSPDGAIDFTWYTNEAEKNKS